MPRKMVVQLPDGSFPMLTEEPADEAQLQELVKRLPELIPVEEFGMAGPMMVVGRETRLPSGAVDLVGMTQAGEILVIEFKTGPQNPDFRAALSQLLDYGSDLWSLSYEEFESAVPLRYFDSDRCDDPRTKRKSSLEEAMVQVWPELSAEQRTEFRDAVARRLASGHFDYILIAQQFRQTIMDTMEYLNHSIPGSRFYAVELVKFGADPLSVFETRTTLKPTRQPRPGTSTIINEARFLEGIDDAEYKAALQRIIGQCHEFGLKFEWGALGTSIRVTVDSKPISVAWLFPPGRVGFMGLTDVTLGYDLTQIQRIPEVASGFETYIQAVAALPGATPARPQAVDGHTFPPEAVVRSVGEIVEALAAIAKKGQGSVG